VLLAYWLKQLHAHACLQLKLLCLTLATVTGLRNVYLGGLIVLNRFVRSHSSGMGSGWIVAVLGMVSWLTACDGPGPNITTAYGRSKEAEDSIVRDRIANAHIDDPNRNFSVTCMIVHGCAPSGFGASSVISIPKKHNINVADSNNFRGIALSSFFVSFLMMLFLRNFMLICALLIFSLVSNLGILLACVPWSSKRLLLIMLQIIHPLIVRSWTPPKRSIAFTIINFFVY